MRVVIVQTGTANTASVLAGLRRAGATPRLSTDPREVETADRVVLPGVGHFGAGMRALVAAGLHECLRDRIGQGRATLGICLGLQMLCEGSEESPGVAGLGVLPVRARRFDGPVRVPQLGWNQVTADGCELLTDGYAYYANSYCLPVHGLDGWKVATTTHGAPFAAAVERGKVLACQFHPELSSAWGQQVLARWLEVA